MPALSEQILRMLDASRVRAARAGWTSKLELEMLCEHWSLLAARQPATAFAFRQYKPLEVKKKLHNLRGRLDPTVIQLPYHVNQEAFTRIAASCRRESSRLRARAVPPPTCRLPPPASARAAIPPPRARGLPPPASARAQSSRLPARGDQHLLDSSAGPHCGAARNEWRRCAVQQRAQRQDVRVHHALCSSPTHRDAPRCPQTTLFHKHTLFCTHPYELYAVVVTSTRVVERPYAHI